MIRTHKSTHTVLKVTINFVLLLIAVTTSPAQTPTPMPKSAEVLRLEEEKAQAELRKAIAEANKAELEAKFPKPTSTPLSGTTTVDNNVLIEPQIVAYVSMAQAANRIVDAINSRDLKVNKLIVFNEDDVKLLLGHKVATSQLDIIKNGYCSLLATAVTGGNCAAAQGLTVTERLKIAQSFLGSFVDLTSFFRTNVDIKGQNFDIDEAPLVAEVIRAARRTNGGFPSGTELYYPRMFAPDLSVDQEYKILALLDKVQSLRNIAAKQISDLEKNAEELGKAETRVKNIELNVEQLKASIADRRTKLGNLLQAYCPRIPASERQDTSGLEARLFRYCPSLAAEQRERVFTLAQEIGRFETDLFNAEGALTRARNALNQLNTQREELVTGFQQNAANPNNQIADPIAQLKARNDQFDRFLAAIVQAPTGNGPNALTSYIKAENLQEALREQRPDKNSFWLQLKVVEAGGNNRIKTNLIWDVFTGGNRVSHSGGVIVEYILYTTTGQAITADTITQYTNYIKSNKVGKLTTAMVDDMPVSQQNARKKSDEQRRTNVAKRQ